MATEERDHTADWIVPAERRPPSAFDLQRQIDVAMAVARAAEEAAMELGQAAIDAAEQARIAAVHAERSAAASAALARGEAPDPVDVPPAGLTPAEAPLAATELPADEQPPEPPAADEPAAPEPPVAAAEPVADPPVAAAEPPTAEEPVPGVASGHEEIPGSELPFAWSPVGPEPAAATLTPVTNGSGPAPAPARPARPTAQPDPFDERMIAFRERAERVMVRLARLDAAPPVS